MRPAPAGLIHGGSLGVRAFDRPQARSAGVPSFVQRPPGLVVIDEVQKVPALLDEVHWLIENTGSWFLLTGSSARKLRRGHANHLARRTARLGSREFGKSFEQLVLMELRAYQAYERPDLEIRFWRTAHGLEVDFVLDDLEVAIEVKGSSRVHEGDLRGLRALAEDGAVGRELVVCLESEPRTVEPGIEILPWSTFCERLWAGDLGV
jgi:predicted AAA+ superfamily ATPase